MNREPIYPIWKARLEQNNEYALQQYLAQNIGQRVKELLSQFERNSKAATDFTENDFSLFAVSLSIERLLRTSHGETLLTTLKRLRSLRLVSGLSTSFLFEFEMGLTWSSRGEIRSAIEHFARAKSVATGPLEEMVANTNLIFCMDDLGLDPEGEISELTKAIGQRCSAIDTIVHGVRQQLLIYETRCAWRRGDGALVARRTQTLSQSQGQGLFFAAQLIKNPFLKPWFHNQTFLSSVFLSRVQSSGTFGRDFRTNTVLGYLDACPSSPPKIGDVCDRLYLWTCEWILNGTHMTFSRIASCLEILAELLLVQEPTFEDLFLIRNSVGWLCLLDNRFFPVWRIAQQRIGGKKSRFSLFEYENHWISCLYACVRNEPQLASDLLLTIPPLEFPTLHHEIRGLVEHYLGFAKATSSSLAFDRLAACILPRPKESGFFYINLDTGRSCKWVEGTETEINSLEIAKTLDLFSRKQSVETSDFMREVFGIRRFDPDVHKQKLANFLLKFRKFIGPDFAVSVRRGMISTSSQLKVQSSRDKASMLQETEAILHLGQLTKTLASRLELTFSKPRQSVPYSFGETTAQHFFSRSDLVKRLSKSNATVNRILKKWLEAGHIVQVGQGRSTAYRAASGSAILTDLNLGEPSR